MNKRTPEPWATAMVEADAVSPRGEPSINRLARMSGVAVETVRRLISSKGSSELTISKVAGALKIDVTEVSRWAGQCRSVSEPYVLPGEAHLMTARQRDAMTELIRAITEEQTGRRVAPEKNR